MSKSLKFCKRIASDKFRSSFADRNWTDAIEIDSEKFFTNVLKIVGAGLFEKNLKMDRISILQSI